MPHHRGSVYALGGTPYHSVQGQKLHVSGVWLMEWYIATRLVGITAIVILPLLVVLLTVAGCVVALTVWLYRVGIKRTAPGV